MQLAPPAIEPGILANQQESEPWGPKIKVGPSTQNTPTSRAAIVFRRRGVLTARHRLPPPPPHSLLLRLRELALQRGNGARPRPPRRPPAPARSAARRRAHAALALAVA